MKIKVFIWYALYQIRFFIAGLFKPRFLSSRANNEVKNLKRVNKTYRTLQYNKARALLDLLNDRSLIIIIVGILIASIYVTQTLTILGILHTLETSSFLSDFIMTQGTLLFALVAFFPIAALLQGASFKDNSIKDEIMQIIKRETRVFELIVSSILLLCYLLLLRYLDQMQWFKTGILNEALASIVLLWFFTNIFGVYYLISRGFYLLKPLARNESLVRYVANEAYPIELASLLRINIYFMLSNDQEYEDKYVSPKINIALSTSNTDKSQVEIELERSQQLCDIDLSKLEYVISRWKKRNKVERNPDRTQRITITFPVMPGSECEGKTCLCQVSHGADLTNIEKLLIKSAFKFRKSNRDENESARIERCMKILEESNLDSIKARSLENFRAGLSQQIDFHTTLIKLGEFEDEGQHLNYSTIASSKFLTDLNQEWSSSYHDIFQSAVDALIEDKNFFKKCCYVGNRLLPDLLNNPSYIGVTSAIQAQGYLWFRLCEWWKSTKDSLIYSEVKKSYLEGWESIQHALTSRITTAQSWKEFSLLFSGLKTHLEYTISFVAQSVITNNMEGMALWTDSLIRWNSNNTRSLNTNHYETFFGNVKIVLSSELLDKPWKEVQVLLNETSEFPNNTFTEQAVFLEILENYWKDACLTLACLLLKWEETSNQDNPLYIDALDRLLKGTLDDEADILGEKEFIKNANDYVISFLRRYISDNGYANSLDGLSRRLDSLAQPEMMPGRIYSSCSPYFGGNPYQDLLLGSLIVGINKNKTSHLPSFEKPLLNYKSANNLIGKLEQYLELLEKINREKNTVILNKIVNEPNSQTNVTEINIPNEQIISDKNSTDSLDVLRGILSSLKDRIISWKANFIKNLTISDSKLQEIIETASSVAFTKDTASFPVCLFQKVEWVTKPLKELNFGYSEFSKITLIEPAISEDGFSKNWYLQSASPKIYAYLIFDILEKAKSLNVLNEIIVNGETEYVTAINQHSQQMQSIGLHPILIVEEFRRPEWLSNWKSSRWNRQITLQDDLNIQYKNEANPQENYLFHINNVPVYTANALIGGSMLLPIESLKLLQFRQMENGYPLDVTFIPKKDDPTKGSLIYRVEKGIELENHTIYKITYPKN